jgi:hypothetical protein
MPSIQPFTDLTQIFDEGYRFTCDVPHSGMQNVTISTCDVGSLTLTSGALLPWDLLMIPDDRYRLKRTIAPGKYPVVLSVASFVPDGDTRIAAARLQINDAIPVRWEPAFVALADPDGSDCFSYGVDSGTGSFMDTDVARTLASLDWEDPNAFEQFCNHVVAEMENNSVGANYTAGWANIVVNRESGANVVTFSSGWGDGGYASFWGFDDSDQVACVVTDFALFGSQTA